MTIDPELNKSYKARGLDVDRILRENRLVDGAQRFIYLINQCLQSFQLDLVIREDTD